MKFNIKEFAVLEESTMKEALKISDRALGIAFVVDQNYRLQGVVTDGDIKRAALSGKPLSSPVSQVMNTNFKYFIEGSDLEYLKSEKVSKLNCVPVVSNDGILIDYLNSKDFLTKTALITGITGQDGAYLAKFLLDKGYRVVGGYRRTSTDPFERLRRLNIIDKVKLVPLDMDEITSMIAIIEKENPVEIYNLAAQSFVDFSFRTPFSTGLTTGLGVVNILEAIRRTSTSIRFYQASTSEMYGNAHEAPQTEKTPFRPNSPYATAKLYGHWITNNYRDAYGIHASSGILFNHESPLRGLEFVTRKITNAAARIKLGVQDTIHLGNLEAQRDWGYAYDYVEAMWLMLQQETPDDYVIATGETHSVKEFLEITFELAELDVERHLVLDPQYIRPLEVHQLIGDPGKAKRRLKWNPTKTSFEKLIRIMYNADFEWNKSQMNEKSCRLYCEQIMN